MNARQFDDAFDVDYERGGSDNCKNIIRQLNSRAISSCRSLVFRAFLAGLRFVLVGRAEVRARGQIHFCCHNKY